MEDKKRRGLSVRSDFLQEMRDLSMRLIEAMYFIFFLPLSAIEHNTELSSQVMITAYTSLSSLLNLAYFTLLYVVKTKAERWRLDLAIKGYWIEVGESKSDKTSIPEWNPKRAKEFNKGDLVTHESKVYRLEGYGENIEVSGTDKIIYVSTLLTSDSDLQEQGNCIRSFDLL